MSILWQKQISTSLLARKIWTPHHFNQDQLQLQYICEHLWDCDFVFLTKTHQIMLLNAKKIICVLLLKWRVAQIKETLEEKAN